MKKKTNRITSKQTDWKKYVDILEDREYELNAEDFVNRCEENRYIFVVDILKKAAFEASGKRWTLSEGMVQRCVIPARYRGRDRKSGRNRNPVEWWDEECDRLEDRKRAC